jgi:hypothetical protein
MLFHRSVEWLARAIECVLAENYGCCSVVIDVKGLAFYKRHQAVLLLDLVICEKQLTSIKPEPFERLFILTLSESSLQIAVPRTYYFFRGLTAENGYAAVDT